MIKILITPTCLIVATLIGQSRCAAELILTFDLAVHTSEVRLGEAVQWDVFLTVSEGPDAGVTTDNYGIASSSFVLTDSLREAIEPARIGDPFSGYSFKSPGEFFEGQLLGVGVTLFSQNNAAVRGADVSNVDNPGGLGPVLLASGSYTPTALGLHTLSTSAFDPNEYFTTTGQFLGAGSRQFDELRFQSTTFRVSNVPEPSGMLAISCSSVFLLLRRKRR